MKIFLSFVIILCYQFVNSDVIQRKTRVSINTKRPSSSKKLLFATGYNFIHAITKNDVYLDKSLFIKYILELEKKIILLTNPPLFGKSMNLNMLKVFLEPCVEETSSTVTVIPANETVKYKFFTKGVISSENNENKNLCERYEVNALKGLIKSYDSPPLISKHQDFVDHKLASHHVIFVNWTSISDWGTSYSKFRHVFEDFISMNIFRQYGYLERVLQAAIKSGVHRETIKQDVQHFRKILQGDALNKSEILTSLKFLSKIMHQHLNKTVFILMDEWMAPLAKLMLGHQTVISEGKQIIDFLSNFITSTFQDNPYLEKAILTGVLAVNKNQLFANLTDDLIHYNVFHNDLYEFCGLAESDLETLINYFQIPPKDVQKMITLYKGYTFTRHCNSNAYNIKCISDFLNFNKTKTPCPSSAIAMRKWFQIEKFKNIWKSLLNGSSVTIQFTEMNLEQYDYLHNITNIWGRDQEADNQALNLILSFLFQIGTLTIGDEEKAEKLVEISLPSKSINVRIPNLFLKKFIKKIFNSSSCTCACSVGLRKGETVTRR